MRAKYFFCLTLSILFFSIGSLADELRCQIDDLATGQVLVEVGPISLQPEDLKKPEPYQLTLEHSLIRAEFHLSYAKADSEDLLLDRL